MWLVLLLLALIVWRIFNGLPSAPSGLVYLNRRDAAAVRAAAETMFPPGGDDGPGGSPLPSAAEADVVRRVDHYFGWQPPVMRLAMKAMFTLFEHGTLLFVPTWARFSQLDDAARIDYLAGWERSRLYHRRLLFQSLRAVLCMAYLADEGVEKALGYERPPACRDKAVA